MKYFFIIENNEPHETGGGYYAPFKFAEYLSLQGHDVSIFAVHDKHWVKPSNLLKLFFRPKVSRKNKIKRKADKLIEKVIQKIWLKKMIKERQPDFILGVFTHSAILATQLAKEFNIPVANFIYESPLWLKEVFGAERFERENQGYIQRVWQETREAYLASDILFPNSTLAGEYCQKWLNGKEMYEPIYPGVEKEKMPFTSAPPKLNEQGKKQLLYIGRLSDNKNVDAILRAFHHLKNDCVLHICGNGPEKEKLIKMANGDSNIHFHGFVSDEFLWQLFQDCSLVLYPSSFEGFGMPPMQALYYERPCLANRLPVLQSIYKDYIEYFDLKDEDSFKIKIDHILDNEDHYLAKAKSGRNYVLENFTWEKAADTIVKNTQKFLNQSIYG